jgi:hypothetical protein
MWQLTIQKSGLEDKIKSNIGKIDSGEIVAFYKQIKEMEDMFDVW